jgi:hypothetical protein
LTERIRKDRYIGMEVYGTGFDYFSYGGDLKVSMDGVI